MARVVIDARPINTSTGHYMLRLLQYLEKIDNTNEYIVLVPSKDLDFWKPTNPNFSIMAADFKSFTFAEQLGFNRLLKSLRADLVHFMMPQQPILYKGKTITTIHDLIPFQTWNSDKNWIIYHAKQLVGRIVVKRIGKTSDFILVPTKFIKEQYANFSGISRKKIVVTYESADLADTICKEYTSPFKKYLLYVGQQSDYKNLIRLVKAHQQLLDHYPDLGLILVGKINRSKAGVYQYVKDTDSTNVHFTGYIPDEERNWLFPHCEAYVFPSTMEGFGLPPLEAMINGAPVISSNASCMPELYGDAVEYFDPFSVDDMSNKISRVLSNRELRSQMVQKGFKCVSKFSWEKCAQETLSVYKKSLNQIN